MRQIDMKLRGRGPEPNHQWDPVTRRWYLTEFAIVRGALSVWPRVRYSYDSACWYDKATGEIHSPHLARVLPLRSQHESRNR